MPDLATGDAIGAAFPITLPLPSGITGRPIVHVSIYPGGTSSMYSDGTLRDRTGRVLIDIRDSGETLHLGGGLTDRDYPRMPDGSPIRYDFAAIIRGETPAGIVAQADALGLSVQDVVSGYNAAGEALPRRYTPVKRIDGTGDGQPQSTSGNWIWSDGVVRTYDGTPVSGYPSFAHLFDLDGNLIPENDVPSPSNPASPSAVQPASLGGTGLIAWNDGTVRFADGTVANSGSATSPVVEGNALPYTGTESNVEPSEPIRAVDVGMHPGVVPVATSSTPGGVAQAADDPRGIVRADDTGNRITGQLNTAYYGVPVYVWVLGAVGLLVLATRRGGGTTSWQ